MGRFKGGCRDRLPIMNTRLQLENLSDDHSLVDAGSVVSFDQGRPQVSLDGIFLRIGCVEADVVVGFECAGFEFQLERRRLQTTRLRFTSESTAGD